MSITYEKFDNYYIFSHEPQKRVYLGSHNPDDYAWDEEQQLLRTASAWYKEVHSGKVITWKDIADYPFDGSLPGNGQVWYGDPVHEFDKRENHTFEGGFTHTFERRIAGLATFGNFSEGRSATYVPEFKTEAWAYVSGKTIEEQKEVEKKVRESMDEFNRNHPWLVNLHDRLGYLDDDGNQITVEQHIEAMKKRYGDDVFELAEKNNPISPEVEKLVEAFNASLDS